MDLADQLRPHIEKQDTVMRKALRVEQKLAIALYKLAHGASYQQLGQPLGVSPSISQVICQEVYLMICRYLQPEYIKFQGAGAAGCQPCWGACICIGCAA